MRKTIIGIALLISGIMVNSFLILSAILYMPHMTAWSNSYPSKLFFLIFAGQSCFDDGADGLGLGVPFILGITLILFGLVVLAIEYFEKDDV